MGRKLLVFTWLVAACGGGGGQLIDAGGDGARLDGGAEDVDAPAVAIDAAAIDGAVIDGAAAIDAPDPDASPCGIGLDELLPATLTVTTDDNTRVYLNGVLIDQTPYVWSDPHQYTVMIYRHPSRTNLLALEGINRQNTTGYDRGILADLRYVVPGSPTAETVVTDAGFRATNELAIGWGLPGFDDSAWPAAVDLGAHGIAPWGSVFSTLAPSTTAHWIWTYDPATNPNKPEVESTYARRTFTVHDPACPVDTL